MARYLSNAVAILAVLWLIRDLYALESNQTSNDGDIYFDDSANRSSTPVEQPAASGGLFPRRGTYLSAWSTAGEDDVKSKDGNQDQRKSDSPSKFPGIIDSFDLNQLLKYVLSLVNTLNEKDQNPSVELKDQSDSDMEDVANDQNKSFSSPALSSKTNMTMIMYTKHTSANTVDGGISEDDEIDFDYEEDYYSSDANNKSSQEPETINSMDQAMYANTTMTLLSQNPSINESRIGMLGNDPVDDNNGVNLDITSSNTTIENNIPTFRISEEEFIDFYINKQSNLSQYDQQKNMEKTNNTAQPTIINKGINKIAGNQVPGDEVENSLVPSTIEDINNPVQVLDQNQNNKVNPVIEKQSIPQISVYNIDTKEIPHPPYQNPFQRVNNLVLPNKGDEQISDLYRTPRGQDSIVQFPPQDTYVRSPFQNVPEPYNEPEPFNNQNSFNQKESINNFNPGSGLFTYKLNPSAQQLPSNVLPLQFSGYSYNQQYDRNPAVSEPRDQLNIFQQDVLPQNNPMYQYNLNQDTNVLPKSTVNSPPHLTHYKLKLPLHIRPIRYPSYKTNLHISPPVSGSPYSGLPQEKNIFDDKFTNPVLENKEPLYTSLANERPINPLNQEIPGPENKANLLKQPNSQMPQTQIRTPSENPIFAQKIPNIAQENSAIQNQAGYLLVENEFPQVTIAPPRDTTEVLIQSNNNNMPLSEIPPNSINRSLPQNEYSNAEIQPLQDIFNNTTPIFQIQLNTEESSQQEDKTNPSTLIPTTNLENFTATTEQSTTMINNLSIIEPRNLTFYNFSQELQPKGNSTSLDDNSSSGSSDDTERENEEQSDLVESGNEEESDLVESGKEEESDLVESENEEESDADESESEEESDADESEEDSDTDESENKEESGDSAKSNNDESEYEEEFGELLRVLDYMEEIFNNGTTAQSLGNSSTTDMEYLTKTPTNFTDSSTQSENIESPIPEETFNTILEYILKFSNNPIFTGLREEKNVTME